MMMMIVMVISVIFTWSPCSWTFRKTACVQWNTHPCRHTREPVLQCQPQCSLRVSNESLKRNVFRKTSINKAQHLSCKKMEKFWNYIHERWYTLPGYQTVFGDTQIKVKILKIHKQLLDIKRKFKGKFNHWRY